MRILNLGILAHVDAGKTSLTERLLHTAGVIDAMGSVDAGSTQTDSLALERQRGITIRSAVVSFEMRGVTVNLIDTPGHPDFIAEVERVLNVLDGVVLVIAAVEGVQSQTRVLMRALQRLRIPTLIFVNKIDRRGAEYERVLTEIREKLTPAIVAMGTPRELGTREASFAPFSARDTAATAQHAELLAANDDTFLREFVEGESGLSYRRTRRQLAVQARRALVHPVFFGSALTGAGVEPLTRGITDLLPAADGTSAGPVSAVVFKIERDPAGEKIAYLRVFDGAVRVRDRLRFQRGNEARVTAISVFERGTGVQRAAMFAGQIGKVWGLGDVQFGDTVGDVLAHPKPAHFAPPTLESVIAPLRPADKGPLYVALSQLAQQDPLINLRQDDSCQELFVSLYGEVQKEVIQATLANDYGLKVEFRNVTPICIERPASRGEAVEILRAKTPANVTGASSPTSPNPFLATLGLRVDPAPFGAGLEFRLDVGVRLLPLYIYKRVDLFVEQMTEYVRETLREGLVGWQVADCTVTLIDCGYRAPGTTAGDFRKLTPLVLMQALKDAGTQVYEPMHRFRLELPAEAFGAAVPVLAELRAIPHKQEMRGSSYVLEGDIPAAQVHQLQLQLPELTGGEGVLECAFERYQVVAGPVPERPRSDQNPLNRKEYLLHVLRRV